jgi:GH24 family phage-related lysozyme (muramidase)
MLDYVHDGRGHRSAELRARRERERAMFLQD